ncbi:DUF2059 domain-containing protein [Kordiimonas sp. SCSIO 12603]|uniref:DUF2059 domain-containing protein n=1 Tax=Kordiimonas sp. SCSIO 12603 TaxID=2829596 RepID=UPI00210642E8|nr:DUF2059 domain-containing protein [Kordiimonas sp. SCSIO 12603]UTW58824.1 DUF2059 domain-containing protein [Kordiimonas sp. SCSIO 12603]
MNDQTPITATASADFDQKIQTLFGYTKMDLIIKGMEQAFMQQAVQSIKNQSQQADPAALEETLTAFQQEYQLELPQLTETIVEAYKTAFTEAEVEAVNVFYASDAGQKFLEGGHKIEQQLQPLTQAWAQQAGKNAFERALNKVNSA